MSSVNITGYVIRKLPHRNFDEVVTILTSDGFISLYALGIRKITSKNAVAMQLGNSVTAEIFKSRLTSKLSKLKKAALVKQPPLYVSDTAMVLFEIIKLIQSLQKSDATFFMEINESFGFFGRDYNHHIKTYIYFRSLRLMGLSPNLTMCVVCGRSDKIRGFSFTEGGYMCNLHSTDDRSVSFLRALANVNRSFELYKTTDADLNQHLFIELLGFIKANNFF